MLPVHALVALDEYLRIRAALTDGAARITTSFDLLDRPQTFDLLGRAGPTELIRRVRGRISPTRPRRHPLARNKTSDDATLVYFA